MLDTNKKKLQLSLNLLAIATIASFTSNKLIPILFPERVISSDIVFQFVPYVQWSEFFPDLILITMLILFFYVQKADIKKYLPYYIVTFAVMYFVRAIFNILTPLQRPIIDTSAHILVREQIVQNGMFPSGHTSFAFLLFLFVDQKKHPKAKLALGILFMLFTISMAVSRGHYSIDIAGGMMLSYIIFINMKRFKKQLKFDKSTT